MNIVDGSHMMHRSKFIALETIIKELDKDSWKPMVYLFGSMLFKAIKDAKDKDVIVLWDKSGSARRRALWADHKAHAPTDTSTPEGLRKSLELEAYTKARQYVNDNFYKLGIRNVMVKGVEADDIGYRLVNSVYKDRNDITLTTQDYDWMQTLREGVRLYRPMANQFIEYSSLQNQFPFAKTHEEIIKCHQWVRAFCGKGNEVAGVSGVGPSYAMKVLIKIYESGDLNWRSSSRIDEASGNKVMNKPQWIPKGVVQKKAYDAMVSGETDLYLDLVDYSNISEIEDFEIVSDLNSPRNTTNLNSNPNFMDFLDIASEIDSSQFGGFVSYLDF